MWETWKTKTDVAISMPFLFVFLSMFTLIKAVGFTELFIIQKAFAYPPSYDF